MKNTVLWLVLIALCVSPLLLAGCDGTVYSYEERMRRGRMIREYDFRQAVDDWDQFWLQDRNLRSSQWHPRVGL